MLVVANLDSFTPSMELKVSHEPAAALYPEPDESNAYSQTTYIEDPV
jgi:hypothetical protein